MSSTVTALFGIVAVFLTVALQGCGSGGGSPSPSDIPKVSVAFHGEAGCPYCQNFTMYALKHAVDTAGINSIMDLQTHWFGNAYYITDDDLCGGAQNLSDYVWATSASDPWTGYTPAVRQCYETKCGAASGKAEECYEDGPYCQHGKAECVVNTILSCSQATTNNDFSKYVPFSVCMESAYRNISNSVANVHKWCDADDRGAINFTVTNCSESTGLNADDILKCYWEEYSKEQAKNARETPVHPSVPYVTITNKSGVAHVLKVPDNVDQDPGLLLRAVCAAWSYNGGAAMDACRSQDIAKAVAV